MKCVNNCGREAWEPTPEDRKRLEAVGQYEPDWCLWCMAGIGADNALYKAITQEIDRRIAKFADNVASRLRRIAGEGPLSPVMRALKETAKDLREGE